MGEGRALEDRHTNTQKKRKYATSILLKLLGTENDGDEGKGICSVMIFFRTASQLKPECKVCNSQKLLEFQAREVGSSGSI